MRKTKNMKKVAAVLLAASVSVNLLSLTSLADQTGYDTQSESDTTDDSSADADTDADSSSDSEDTTSEETSGEETSSEDTSASGEDTSEGAGEDQGNEDGSTIVSQTSESETTNADLGDVSPSQDVTLEMTPGSTTTVTQNVVVDLEEIANNNMEIPEELKNGAESASRPITDEAGNEIGTETFTPVYATDGTTVIGYNVVRTTQTQQEVPKQITDQVTVETAPIGYTEGSVTTDVTDDDGNVIGSTTVTTEGIYGSDGTTVIGYQVTTTTTTVHPASEAAEAADNGAVTTITLPERPEEQSVTIPSTGDVMTVTVEDILDESGDVIGYRKTTVLTNADGVEQSRNSETIYGTTTTVNTQTAIQDNPNLVETTVTEVKTVLGPTTTSTMNVGDWAEIELETITISESETYQLVETDEGTFFVYKGNMWPVIAQSGHGQVTTTNLTPNFDGLVPTTENSTNQTTMLTNRGTLAVSNETGNFSFWFTGGSVQSAVVVNTIFANGTNGFSFPKQLELVDAEGNKHYVLCCDLGTTATRGTGYDMTNVDTADYFEKDGAAAHVKAIALNGYWGTEEGLGSLESVKQFLADNTDLDASLIEKLTPGEALTATQAALWFYGNSNTEYKTVDYDNITTYMYHSQKDSSTFYYARYMSENEKMLVSALCSALININPAAVNDTATTLITEDNFATSAAIVIKDKTGENANGKDTYDTDVSFTLEMYPSMFNDDLIVTVKDTDGNTIATRRIAGDDTESGYGYAASQVDDSGNTVYTLHNLQIAEGVTITLNLSGTQYLNQGVYLYNAGGVFDKSQTFIGIAEGNRNVNLSVDLSFEIGDPVMAIEHSKDTTVSSRRDPIPEETTVYANMTVTETGGSDGSDGSDSSSGSGSSGSASGSSVSTQDLLDGDVPLYSMLLEDLPMMQTALANAPHTGDHMALWLSLSVLSGLGLAVMTISRKKIYG